MKAPLWSVMIPYHNQSDLIEETLSSVISQYYNFDNIQISIVDNCSTDSGKLQNKLKKFDSNIEYVRHDKNIGMVNNFNACIDLAKGELIHILHADDYVLNGFYNEIELAYSKYPNAGVFFTNFSFKRGDKISEVQEEESKPGISNKVRDRIFEGNIVQCAAIVVKKSVYQKIGKFDTNFYYCVDWEMWQRIFSKFDVFYSNKILAVYRIHENSQTALIKVNKNIRDIRKCINHSRQYLIGNPNKNDLINKAKNNYSNNYFFGLILPMIKKGKLKKLIPILYEIHCLSTFKWKMVCIKRLFTKLPRYLWKQ